MRDDYVMGSSFVEFADQGPVEFHWVGIERQGRMMTLDAKGDLTITGEIHAANYSATLPYERMAGATGVLSVLAVMLVWQNTKAARLLRELRTLRNSSLRAAP